MKLVTENASRTWALQAYLAASPRFPKWCDVSLDAINGYRRYRWWEKGSPQRDPRMTERGSGWAFVSAEAAQSVLSELMQEPQKYFLRVIQRETVTVEAVLSGYDIDNGAVMRNPDGSRPGFMGAPVEGCVDAMPEFKEAY